MRYQERLKSLDVFRGFAMLWIIGMDALIHSLARVWDNPIIKALSDQFIHATWNGFRFYDLIFPMFMFATGIAIPFSLGKQLKLGMPKYNVLSKAAKRTLILIFLGVLYNNRFSFDFENMRYASVLGQIGVAYFIGASLYLYLNVKGQFLSAIGILLGFWLCMTLIPVPGIGAGVLTPEGNLSGFIDRLVLPGTLYRGNYDPQGVLLMISASVITIAGALVGTILRHEKLSQIQKLKILGLIGLVLVGVSLVWNWVYPINKEIWSSSYNVLTIGLSMILFTVFYYIVDIKKWRNWILPFILIGFNPILIYMAHRMVNFSYTSKFILIGFMELSGNFSEVVMQAGVLLLEIGLLYILHRNKVYLKI